MIESIAEPFVFKGKLARMSVIRSNGYCWGRIRFDGGAGPELDVSTRIDHYEDCDEDAIAAFIRSARSGHTEPALGWTDDDAADASEARLRLMEAGSAEWR